MSDPVRYTAVLAVRADTVRFGSDLLSVERRRQGTRRRAVDCWRQAVLVWRWFVDGTRLGQLARDNRIGVSTAYRYLHEDSDVLAAAAPRLRGARLAARAAGHAPVHLDGTLIRTDRCRAPGPTCGADLWGRPVVVGQAPSARRQRAGGDGAGRLAAVDLPGAAGPWHDTAGARAHDGLLDTLPEWTDPWHAVGADLGYAAENTRLTCPIKTPRGGELTTDPHTVNTLHAAALVLLHHQHDHTT